MTAQSLTETFPNPRGRPDRHRCEQIPPIRLADTHIIRNSFKLAITTHCGGSEDLTDQRVLKYKDPAERWVISPPLRWQEVGDKLRNVVDDRL